MAHKLAIDDKDTPFSHVAFRWEDDPGIWNFLCAGRTSEEFQQRVQHWISKGVDPASIRQYACQLVESQPQPETRDTPAAAPTSESEGRDQRSVQNAAKQPVPMSCAMWNAISERRPQAYFLLQKYNVSTAIVTVGTSRTKLEFPTCPAVGHDGHDWTQFDRDPMNPRRPIIVLDGLPETGFKPFPGLGTSGLRGEPQ